MSERIPTAEDIRLALVSVGYTEDEAAEGVERIKKRGIGIGHEMARETMQASVGEAFRKAQAKAWAEGAQQGWDDCEAGVEEMSNPYREGAGFREGWGVSREELLSDETTMSDELRDRIAAKLELGTSCCELCWESAKEVAQAIIDDLGLVEERTVRVVDHGAGEIRTPESRVVGKWERS